MTFERWQRIKEIIGEVLDSGADPAAETLHALCEGDKEMVAEVYRLLSEYRRVSAFLERPVGELSRAGQRAFEPGQIAAGRYQIIKHLGEGGMGEVWEARDQDLH